MHTSETIQDGLPHGPDTLPYRISPQARLAASLGGLKIVCALLMLTPLLPNHNPLPSLVPVGLIWAFCGALLLAAHSRETRTANIGVVLILAASVFSAGWVRQGATDTGSAVLLRLTNICADTFLPYFLCQFLLEFPQPRTGTAARWLAVCSRISVVLGTFLFVLFLSRSLTTNLPPWPFAINLLNKSVGNRDYWVPFLSFCLVMTGIAFIGHRGWLPEDRRRGNRLLAVAILLVSPFAVQAAGTFIAELVPSLQPNAFRGLPLALTVVGAFVLPVLLVRTALTGRRVRTRLLLRRTLRALLNSPALLSLAVVPIVAALVRLWIMREQPVQVALSPTTVAWLLVALAAAVARRWRHSILGSIDARFFRDRYDASDALRDVSDRLHHVSGVDELVACLTSAIDRALRPWKVTVLLRSESRSHFVSLFGATDPLPASSLLAELAIAAAGPLDTAVAGPTSPLRWLPLAERLWLVDSGARLLVPLRASDRTLLGVIALGDRRSGRPYDDGDRQWMHDFARVAAQTIEAHSATSNGHPSAWRVGLVERHTRAHECARCGLVMATDHSTCPNCRAQLEASGVPLVLFGKFQFERRVGRGGQGLVYRARDLSLDRPVAIKALPGTSPEHAERLRQEARVMAAITHRHLAVIYGMESWRGQPLLLCEFMEQGTLADRLEQAPLSLEAALALGVALTDALGVIHSKQLLHRDIKPSNIGYDGAGVPKLLDFGLVHLLSRDTTSVPMLGMLGTPLYMSPEAVAGAPPSHAVDLWSLHVMLYEAMAGTHPFKRDTTTATLRAIVDDVPPPLAVAGGVSAARAVRLAAYFADALSKNIERRPATAAAAADALRALML